MAVRAAVLKVIDFSTARPKERKWWSRYNLIIDDLRLREDFGIQKAAFDFHVGVMGNSRITEESFEKNQENAKKRFWSLAGCQRPWEGRDYEDRTKKEFDSNRQAFIDHVGVDPVDPEFKQWESEQIKRFLADGAGKETDEQRVMRIIAEEGK